MKSLSSIQEGTLRARPGDKAALGRTELVWLPEGLNPWLTWKLRRLLGALWSG